MLPLEQIQLVERFILIAIPIAVGVVAVAGDDDANACSVKIEVCYSKKAYLVLATWAIPSDWQPTRSATKELEQK